MFGQIARAKLLKADFGPAPAGDALRFSQIGMRERVAALGETLDVARRSDLGSKLTAIIPVPVGEDA